MEEDKKPAVSGVGFDSIVKEYNLRLSRVLQPFVRDKDDLEDILQESWTRIYRALPGFRGKSDLFTWIYRIGMNTAISFVRRRKPEKLDAEPVDTKRTFNPEVELDRKHVRMAIMDSLGNLSRVQRDVFILRLFDDMPYEDISRKLGIKVGNAKTTYFYAVRKVRMCLENKFNIRGAV